MTLPLLLRDATLTDGRRVDVRIDGAMIAGVGLPDTTVDSPQETIDLAGYLLLPAPAEPHAHLDKAYSAGRVTNPEGDLGGAVAAWLRYRPAMAGEDVLVRAGAAVRAYLANGVTAIRTHVDVADDIGLRALRAMLDLRDTMSGQLDLQVVAFVGVPLTGGAGARHRALARESLAAGADVLGACPPRDPDPAGAVMTCLDLAATAGVPVDLHIDETLEVQPCTLSMLADAVEATGFAHRVVASHCVSLGMMDSRSAAELADRVAAAGIVVVCLPQTNLYLQGRDRPVATPRGLTALRTLRAAGVTVAAGGDNLQDPFNVLGRADPLEAAALLVLAGHDTTSAAYAAVSTDARSALGLSKVDIVEGAPAELLAIRATTLSQAIAEAPADRVVIHAGRVVARTVVTREFPALDRRPVAVEALR